VKTFAVLLKEAEIKKPETQYKQLELEFEKKVTSPNSYRTNGEIAEGISLPEELYDNVLITAGIQFQLGAADGLNAVVSSGQTVRAPNGTKRIYLLAASVNGETDAYFTIGCKRIKKRIQAYNAVMGRWGNSRLGAETILRNDEIAKTFTHTHDADGDRIYEFAHIFKIEINFDNIQEITLPVNNDILIFAMTAEIV
jgi:alpha-mannosidase